MWRVPHDPHSSQISITEPTILHRKHGILYCTVYSVQCTACIVHSMYIIYVPALNYWIFNRCKTLQCYCNVMPDVLTIGTCTRYTTVNHCRITYSAMLLTSCLPGCIGNLHLIIACGVCSFCLSAANYLSKQLHRGMIMFPGLLLSVFSSYSFNFCWVIPAMVCRSYSVSLIIIASFLLYITTVFHF